jgi:predicted RNase H-like HicB family nuclease
MGSKMHRFVDVIEQGEKNYSAYSPDLPGCIATSKTRKETESHMNESIEIHVRGLLEDHLPVPESHSTAKYVTMP